MIRRLACIAVLGLGPGCFRDRGLQQDTETGSSSTGSSGSSSETSPTTDGEAVCGDGVLASEEACDAGKQNAMFGACGPTCAINVCGDGIPGPEEDCDDGNNNDGDACRNTCELARCGDGVVQDGEQCDDGNGEEDDACSTRCAPPRCGDGVLTKMEQCDLGDRNADAGHCTLACTTAVCGDGLVQPGEACEPLTANCGMDCRWTTCGDGMVDDYEVCDGEDEKCTELCTVPVCGDGLVTLEEQCDDGNGQDGDDCTATCTTSVCGDGIIAADEACDDMNIIPDDGCAPDCTRDALFAFVTSTTYQGAQVGGLAGADASCQALAVLAGLPGSYRAWLSDGVASPATRFAKSHLPYVLPAGMHGLGVRVAESWVDLVDGTLEHALSVTEAGDMLVAGESCGAPSLLAWTHTGATAGPQEQNASCGGWKFTLNSVGAAGLVNRLDLAWTEGCEAVQCTMALRLYCIEQAP